MQNLKEWLSQVEWYDNHSLTLWQDCKRKWYFNKMFRGVGVSYQVGPQAMIGTCHHAALAAYYKQWNKQTEDQRRIIGMREFSRVYNKLFSNEKEQQLESAYTEERGHQVFDSYCDNWQLEDSLFRPIENELTMIVPLKPEKDENFEPCFIIMRCDGLWEKLSNGDWFILETKTTRRDVKGWLTRLSMDRQGTGYVWGSQQFEGGRRVKGIIPNIILTATEKYDFARDYVMKNPQQLSNWRTQTIRLIQEIRQYRKEWEESHDLNIFTQSHSRCTDFGKCPFFDLCYFSPQLGLEMPLNTWTPLDV